MEYTYALIQNLKRLAFLRLITCAGIALALLSFEIQAPIQKVAALVILLTMIAMSLINLWRAKAQKAHPQEVFSYLLLDSFLIVLLMYFTGGANNPFITYLLVPIVISAATLSWLFTWVLCMFAMLAYGFLLFFYMPLPYLDVQLAQFGLSLHIVGMWLTFVLSSLFIAYFVVEMAFDLSDQAHKTAHFREQSIQNEHLMLLAGQAASTAHELGTPLSTIKILVNELKQFNKSLNPEALDDLKLVGRQIDLCQQKLQHLTQPSELIQSPLQPLSDFIQGTLQHWLLMRPSARFHFETEKQRCEQTVQYPQVLQQAIINLLDNGQDVSAQPIELTLSWNDTFWQLSIKDNGPGIDDGFQLPNSPQASKEGLGIGLLLSHSSIQRLGGKVSLSNLKSENQEAQGCLTTIEMPFHVAT